MRLSSWILSHNRSSTALWHQWFSRNLARVTQNLHVMKASRVVSSEHGLALLTCNCPKVSDLSRYNRIINIQITNIHTKRLEIRELSKFSLMMENINYLKRELRTNELEANIMWSQARKKSDVLYQICNNITLLEIRSLQSCCQQNSTHDLQFKL